MFVQRDNCREDAKSNKNEVLGRNTLTSPHALSSTEKQNRGEVEWQTTRRTIDKLSQRTPDDKLCGVCVCLCVRNRQHVLVVQLCQMYDFNDLQTTESNVDATQCSAFEEFGVFRAFKFGWTMFDARAKHCRWIKCVNKSNDSNTRAARLLCRKSFYIFGESWAERVSCAVRTHNIFAVTQRKRAPSRVSSLCVCLPLSVLNVLNIKFCHTESLARNQINFKSNRRIKCE